MSKRTAVIGIDSLDPKILKKYKNELPYFSKLVDKSPTFLSKSIFPVDTIPAWSSIYTGQFPSNHGILYVYDIFDPQLSDLKKIDISILKGKTFWEIAAKNGLRTVILYPNLIYPAWENNGIMVCRSPFDRRIGDFSTEIDIDVFPKEIRQKYKIPEKFEGVWGGFPGSKNLKKWAELGKKVLYKESEIALSLFKNENWDLFFVYYNILDIIQHRLWRFFDESDPTYPGKTELFYIILDFYKEFDQLVGKFMKYSSDSTQFIILSDHGHKIRPTKTININEYMRMIGYLVSINDKKNVSSRLRRIILNAINKLHVEYIVINLISKNKKLIKAGKSIYSSSDSIDLQKTIAKLSTFAGIKSYSHGGIEINKKIIRNYELLRDELIKKLQEISDPEGKAVVKWASRREEKCSGKYSDKLYPDIIFELDENYGVGWDIYSGLYGIAYDHTVASGGHSKEAVFILNNIERPIKKRDICIVDVAPTLLDVLEIDIKGYDFDGKSIFK